MDKVSSSSFLMTCNTLFWFFFEEWENSQCIKSTKGRQGHFFVYDLFKRPWKKNPDVSISSKIVSSWWSDFFFNRHKKIINIKYIIHISFIHSIYHIICVFDVIFGFSLSEQKFENQTNFNKKGIFLNEITTYWKILFLNSKNVFHGKIILSLAFWKLAI